MATEVATPATRLEGSGTTAPSEAPDVIAPEIPDDNPSAAPGNSWESTPPEASGRSPAAGMIDP